MTLSATAGETAIEVQVRDTGLGIDRDELPHIFVRFYKVDRSRHHPGTGLGLAIVQLHGGGVNAKSEPWVGSTFNFALLRTL